MHAEEHVSLELYY